MSRSARHPRTPRAVPRPRPEAPRADRAARAVQVARARDVHLARGRDRRRAGPGAAGEARDRPGDPEARRRHARRDRRPVPPVGGGIRGRVVRADVPGRLGRPAGAPGSAHPPVHPPATTVDRLLFPQPDRGDHLEDHQRRRGARPARRGWDGDADPVRPDADRRGRDPVRARPAPGAAHIPRAADPGGRSVRVPDRVGRRLSPDPREDRHDHRLSPGDPVGHPRRPRVRPGAGAHQALPRAQRREPRGEHDHRQPERGVLPGCRVPVGDRDRGDPRDRRDRGDQRPHLDRRGVRLHRRAQQLLRPDPEPVTAVHDLPVGDGGARQDLRPARRAA